jgi:antibiotic biosynthesis monooxygenase (ABM) superfamily enzyme
MHEEIVELVPKRVIGPMRTEYLTGLETWFTLPTDPGAPTPPRYKMALLTWITIFPLIAGVAELLGPQLKDFALVPRLAITTAITVPLMTWIAMAPRDRAPALLAISRPSRVGQPMTDRPHTTGDER